MTSGRAALPWRVKGEPGMQRVTHATAHFSASCLSLAGLRGQRAEDDEGERQQSQQHPADGRPSDQPDGLGSDDKDAESKCTLTSVGRGCESGCLRLCYLEESRCVLFFFLHHHIEAPFEKP